MRRLLAGLVVCALATACGDGGSEGVDGGAGDAGPLTHRWSLAPGELAEANFVVGPGGGAVARFTADSDVQWDVHVHVGQDIRVLAEGLGREGTLPFSSASGGRYSFGWFNRATPAISLAVDITTSGDITFHSWVP